MRGPFFRRHAATLAMIGFTALFYAALFLLQRARHEPPSAPPPPAVGMPWDGTAPVSLEGVAPAEVGPPAEIERMTPEELREREERFKRTMEQHPRLFALASLLFLAVLSAGLATDLTLLVQRMRGVEVLPRAAHAPVPWGLPEIARFFVLLFFVEAVVLLLEMGALRLVGAKPNRDVLVMLNSVVRDIVIGALILRTVSRKWGRPWSAIGFTGRDLWKNMRIGALAYLAVVPVLLVLLFVMAVLAQAVRYQPPPQPVVEMYLRQQAQGTLLFFTFFVAVLGPVMEELFFRGFAYGAFRTRYGVARATVVTALIFSALHASVIGLVPIFLLGVFLTVLYERTGSLVPGITAHMLHNLIMVSCTLAFKALSS